MKLMPIKQHKPNLFLVIFLGLILLFVTYVGWKQFSRRFVPKEKRDATPVQAMLRGEYACLPNKPTDGPVTLECALGLKADDGNYYALDMTEQDPTIRSVIQVGQKMEVNGNLLYIKDQNSWALKKYDIKGVLKVEKFKLLR